MIILPLANESLICFLLGMAWIGAMVEAPYKICISGTCGTIAVHAENIQAGETHERPWAEAISASTKTCVSTKPVWLKMRPENPKLQMCLLLISTEKHDLMPHFRFDSGQKSVYASIVMVIMLYHPQNTSEICWWDRIAADLPDWIPWTALLTTPCGEKLGDRNSNLCNVR